MQLLENLRETCVKIVLSIPAGLWFFKNEWWGVITALVWIIVIDTILGMWVGIKYKQFSSWKLGRAGSKIAKYGLSLASVYFLAMSNHGFDWTFPTLGTFFVLTEVISNFEKLSLLGVKFPTHFLSKINSQFKELKEADSKEKIAKEIMGKKC